jgi:hypothetical protein
MITIQHSNPKKIYHPNPHLPTKSTPSLSIPILNIKNITNKVINP